MHSYVGLMDTYGLNGPSWTVAYTHFLSLSLSVRTVPYRSYTLTHSLFLFLPSHSVALKDTRAHMHTHILSLFFSPPL